MHPIRDLFDLDVFRTWADTQDKDGTYDFLDNGYSKQDNRTKTPGCALVQYFRAHGYPDVMVTTYDVTPNPGPDADSYSLPSVMNACSRQGLCKNLSTFGGLVKTIDDFKAKEAARAKVLEPA